MSGNLIVGKWTRVKYDWSWAGENLEMSDYKGGGCEFDSKIVAQGLLSFESPELQN